MFYVTPILSSLAANCLSPMGLVTHCNKTPGTLAGLTLAPVISFLILEMTVLLMASAASARAFVIFCKIWVSNHLLNTF